MEKEAEEHQKVVTKDISCQTEHHPGNHCHPSPLNLEPQPDALEPREPLLLQNQLKGSLSGIEQIIACFRSGSADLLHVLMREVDTIFECKVCHSLFRGLPNLITHKESYCISTPNRTDVASSGEQSQAIKELLEVVFPQKDRPVQVDHLELDNNQNSVSRVLSEDHKSQQGEKDITQQMTPDDRTLGDQQADKASGEDPAHDGEVELNNQGLQPMMEEEPEQEGDKGSSEEGSTRISCDACRKDFSSLHAMRQHCLRVHRKNMEEQRSVAEIPTMPVVLLSVVRGQSRCSAGAAGRDCAACGMSLNTKSSKQRQREKRRCRWDRKLDVLNSDAKPGHPLLAKDTLSPRQQKKVLPRRTRVIDKTRPVRNAELKVSSVRLGRVETVRTVRRSDEASQDTEGLRLTAFKLQMGFDLKQHYCKLCKRQFASSKNLRKHIQLHVEGNEIFIKFYRCPLCRYESRCKRDVLRHLTEVHKKRPSYLEKITAKLESQAMKKPASIFLNKRTGRREKSEVDGGVARSSVGALDSHKHTSSSGSSTSLGGGADVKVKRKTLLHACDVCGQAFARKGHLESHKRNHVGSRSSRSRRRSSLRNHTKNAL